MLHFRNEHWLRVNGRSLFSATIGADDRERKDVYWDLRMEFVAGGAKWRRVRQWERPSFAITLSSIRAPLRTWKDIEQHQFWEDAEVDELDDDWDHYYQGAGLLEVVHCRRPSGGQDYTFGGDHVWRVVERDGRWFTIEMAGLVEGTNLHSLAQELPIVVTADGVEETAADPDETFWKNNSEFYLIEQVAFGLITVKVPRNVRDPEAYAVARARGLVGFEGEPEHLDVCDYSLSAKPQPNISGDLFVHLHINGFYED